MRTLSFPSRTPDQRGGKQFGHDTTSGRTRSSGRGDPRNIMAGTAATQFPAFLLSRGKRTCLSVSRTGAVPAKRIRSTAWTRPTRPIGRRTGARVRTDGEPRAHGTVPLGTHSFLLVSASYRAVASVSYPLLAPFFLPLSSSDTFCTSPPPQVV